MTLKIEIGRVSRGVGADRGRAVRDQLLGRRRRTAAPRHLREHRDGHGRRHDEADHGRRVHGDAVLPNVPDDEQLAEVPFGKGRDAEAEQRAGGAPPPSRPRPSRAPRRRSSVCARSRTLLAKDGFFSHGLEGEVISRAGHTAERISTLIGGEQMNGDDEQYAVAMALLRGPDRHPRSRGHWATTPTRRGRARPCSPRPATTCTPGSRSTSRASDG